MILTTFLTGVKKIWEDAVFELNSLLSLADSAEILGICYRSWIRYDAIAREKVPDYKIEIQSLLKRAEHHGVGQLPVTPYRLWVVGRIAECFQKLPKGKAKVWIVEEGVKAEPWRFSKFAFKTSYLAYKNRRTANAEVYTGTSGGNDGNGVGSVAALYNGSNATRSEFCG